MTGVTSLLLFVNLIEDRPYWLIFLLSMPVPVYLVTGIIISLDLIKKDCVVFHGRLHIKGSNAISVKMNDGRSERFRVNKTIIKDLRNKTDVEVEFFKRTRAVKGIRTKNVEEDRTNE
jgi:hypothetical protein